MYFNQIKYWQTVNRNKIICKFQLIFTAPLGFLVVLEVVVVEVVEVVAVKCLVREICYIGAIKLLPG